VNVSSSALLIDENTEHKTDIDLPTVGINGTTINWSTSDDTVISANGEVYRGNTIKQATLTANISKGDHKISKSFVIKLAPYSGLKFVANNLVSRSKSTSASVVVANDTEQIYQNPVIIMACYNDRTLIGLDIKNAVLTSEDSEYDMECYHNKKSESVKIFLLEKNGIKPLASNLIYEIASEYCLEFDKVVVDTNEPVGFSVYEIVDGEKIPLTNTNYTMTCDGMNVDYNNNTATFSKNGELSVTLFNQKGTCTTTVYVNNSDAPITIKGDLEFNSDFSGDNSLSTYYTSDSVKFSIGKDSNGNSVLRTAGSNTADTLLFGPTMSDYTVEMEFTPTAISGSGVNTISVGLRTKSAGDKSSYRVVAAERWKFDGTNVLFNRIGVGRSYNSSLSEYYFADYSDNQLKFEMNKKYKLHASVCGDKIQGVLYDNDGEILDVVSSTTGECDFNKHGSKVTALASGKTIISFHCLVADINDIKIYGYDYADEISLKSSSDVVSVGDTVTFNVFANGKIIDNGMVEYISADGLDIEGNKAVASSAGEYTIVAKYKDYTGNVKYGMKNITIE
jgi:hypothetical protein